MNELQTILDSACEACRIGGDILTRYFREGVVIRDKSSGGGKAYDLVSDADEQSEKAIATYLRDVFPNHELLGEESLQGGDVDAEHLWIIDPLDGTNNFAHSIEHFAVSIGYYRNGVPTVGAILNPITGDQYTVMRGGGAFRNGNRAHVSDAESMSAAMVGCGFYYDRGEMMRSTLAAIEECFSNQIHGIRRFGTASLDLCMVGTGRLDCFFEYRLSPWDFAAGGLFITEAGGKVTTPDGSPLPIAATGLVASNGKLHEPLCEITLRHQPG